MREGAGVSTPTSCPTHSILAQVLLNFKPEVDGVRGRLRRALVWWWCRTFQLFVEGTGVCRLESEV